MGVPDSTNLNQIYLPAENALQAEFEVEVPVEQISVSFELDQHVNVARIRSEVVPSRRTHKLKTLY